jgi:two-component system sensor histidine kinase/response regulator
MGLKKNQEVIADPIRLKQIFNNLLSNAIKYTPKGSITLRVIEKNKQYIFEIEDTGIGIAKKDYDIIFKEFKVIENPEVKESKGIGLGLPLTKRLIDLHGGSISFKSEKGRGSTFSFTLPIK